MKRIYLITLFYLVAQLYLQAQQTSWQWVNPLPQGNILNSITSINQDTVFAVGDYGTIMKTINGGKTWQVTPTAAGVTEALYSTQFISGMTGWACGEIGRILKTTDAGQTWFPQSISTNKDIFASDFISSSIGWVAGANGIIYKTTTGGNTWILQNSGVTETIYGIFFYNSTNGWAVGTNGKLVATTDGGSTWQSKTTNTIQNLYSVQFISSTVGFAVGAFGTLIKSTNGGNTWIPQMSSTSYSLYGMQFTSPLIGYAIGSFGEIIKTTDGGYSWFEQFSNTYNDLFSVSFSSSTTGWAIGDFGTIVTTIDGGINWTTQSSGTKNILNGISFSSPSSGVAVGEEGTIVLTSDGGTSWVQQNSGTLQTMYGIQMFSNSTGWAVGDSAIILKTTTSGGSWNDQNSHIDLSLYSIFFVNSNTGWAVGDLGTILNTINGGTTWKPETSNVSLPLMRVKFYNTNIGWIVGYGGLILKTINGGHNWISQISNTDQTLYAIDIIDENTVFASGDYGTIVSTTDGGNTWNVTTNDGGMSFYGLAFLNRTTGWAVGDDGAVINTTDGGVTWTNQNSGTLNTLWDIVLVKSVSGGGTLFASGIGGTLICSAVSPLPIRTWTGAIDSLWTNAGNWSPRGTPEKGDSVYIPSTPIRPVLRSLLQQVNLGSLRIDPGATLTIGGGLAQLVVSGTIKIDGTLDIEPTSTLEIITGDNFAFGTYGKLNPAQSIIIVSNAGQLRGSFYNLFITSTASTQSIGNISVKNNLTIHSNMSLRSNDTLTIQNSNPQGFQGEGLINGGTIKRAISKSTANEYRFESPITFVRFYPTGTFPDTVMMTSYPNRLGSGLSDSVFVKRYYNTSAIGGSNYLYFLSLRYDTSETSIPIDNLGFFKDSSGIIFNIGASDYLDSDLVAINLDSVTKFSKWYIGRNDYYWKHPQQFIDSLFIEDHGSSSDTLFYGTAPGATDGIDPYWGEYQLGPKPSLGFFDARWSIPSTNGTDINICNIFTYTHQQVIFTCAFQPGPGGYPITIRWNKKVFPTGTAFLRDGETHGTKFSINMRNQNSFIITDPSVATIQIEYVSPTYYSFNKGWNMISIPVALQGSNLTTTIFPTAISDAFGYDYFYYSADTLTHGIGYWLKFNESDYIPIDGTSLTIDTAYVKLGWNMIGSIGSSIPISHVQPIPADIVTSDYFFYNISYVQSDSIHPANAYWVKTKQAGKLVFSKTGALFTKEENPNTRNVVQHLNTITITDRNGANQTLYFGEKINNNEIIDRYELPPTPPAGIFDARFSSQRYVEFISNNSQRLNLKFQTDSYPVTIKWNINQPTLQSLSLFDASTGKLLDQTKLNGEGIVRISDKSINSIVLQAEATKTIPKEFSLKQNYPNPFNPSTMITFALPVDAIVNLKVYNLLGQEVQTLIDDKSMEAGAHLIEFDSNKLTNSASTSSGLYFYRISVKSERKNFVDVKKMILLK